MRRLRSKSRAGSILLSLAPTCLLTLAVILLLVFRFGLHRPIIGMLLMRYGHAGTATVDHKWEGRHGNTVMVNFQCRPDYAPTIDAIISSGIYGRLSKGSTVKIHFETIWCSWAAIDDDPSSSISSISSQNSSSLSDSKEIPLFIRLMRWIGYRGLVLLVVGFYALRFLWSMAKFTYLQVKVDREAGQEDDPDGKVSALIAKMDQRLRPPSSSKTIKLWIAGLLLGIVGAIGFSTTDGGVTVHTIGYLATLVTGLILVGLGILSGRKDRTRTKLESVLQHGSSWQVSQNFSGEDVLQSQYNGFPVQAVFQNAGYDRSGNQISPAQTIVRFTLPNPSPVKIALRRDTPWWGTDIKDLWARLPRVESVSIDQLNLFGSPPDQAHALVSRWLRQDFDKWHKTVKERSDLMLNLVRVDGKLLEFHFEGWITEPILDEAPSLKQQLDELLRGCLPWCTSFN